VRKRNLLIIGIVILGEFGGWIILNPNPLIKNGAFKAKLEGWECNLGVSIFRDPGPREWRYYYAMVQKVGVLHLSDVFNDRFAAIGAGNTAGSVLSQDVDLNGSGGRYELSFLFAATGDAGLTALLETSVVDAHGRVLALKTITNLQPVKTYFVPLNQQRVEKLTFDVPAGTTSVKLSFADKSPNGGIAVDPLIKNVSLKKLK
jgi:hypothetical protein